jgi:arsenate reductase-like glutaredoxin family protein
VSIVTIQDIRDAGYCPSGARRWFEAHGLDFRDFMANGISEETFLATGDAMATRVVALKRTHEEAPNNG